MKSVLYLHIWLTLIGISIFQVGLTHSGYTQELVSHSVNLHEPDSVQDVQASNNNESKQASLMTIVVSAGEFDRLASPIRIELRNSKLAPGNYYLESAFPWDHAQATISHGEKKGTVYLDFVIRELRKGQTIKFDLDKTEDLLFFFDWEIDKGNTAELKFHDQPVLRYMFEKLNEETKENRARTYKVYHHVFSPDGKTLLTKGPGGLYPHHRGIFFGYNKISYGDQQADTWHCNNGESQINITNDNYPYFFAGSAMAENRNLVHWNGRDGKSFAQELRTLRTYHVDKLQVIDFESTLSAIIDQPIRLKGDPQHAGVQFRASQHVPDKTKTKTFYIRPDGIGKPGEFRNWPADKQHQDLPWNAMCFEIDRKTYTCCYFNHPANPKPASFSERDYGRFGSYFEFELTKQKPLKVKYRYLIREGVMSVDDINRLHKDFTNPMTATITPRTPVRK
ncbi:MAG: hypothetical protein ACI87E_002229 [Mariniblastus sp.]|jgi:hypothetical protein